MCIRDSYNPLQRPQGVVYQQEMTAAKQELTAAKQEIAKAMQELVAAKQELALRLDELESKVSSPRYIVGLLVRSVKSRVVAILRFR